MWDYPWVCVQQPGSKWRDHRCKVPGRILASSQSTSGTWLQSLPHQACECGWTMRQFLVAVGLRSGSLFCWPHKFEQKITTNVACLLTSSTGLLIASSVTAQVCSALDLATGYWKMSVSTEVTEKTALLHTLGLCMNLRTCYWFCSALTTLQGLPETF